MFMGGTTYGCMYNMTKEMRRLDAASQNVLSSTRVQQNESAHALLRTMKFHLSTQQMNIWDQTPR